MNNVNMSGMNAMGGPVGGGMPMMNNGAAGAGIRQAMTNNNDNRSQLNTYIYEYFLKNGMWDCARSLVNSNQPINVVKDSPERDNMGNGVGDDGGEDSKDDIDSKRPSDLFPPNLPKECPESCFLYEWWCLFWDMFNAQRGKGDTRNVLQYVTHTQAQSRMKQDQQQHLLRQMNNNVHGNQYRMGAAGMNMPNELARKAMQNRTGPTTAQHMQMLHQQQQQQQKQQQAMTREPSDGNHQQRPQSPGSAENAPSPSKRPRLDGASFNQQGGMMPNGRGQPAGVPAQQFPGFQGQNGSQKNLAAYQATLSQHQQSQMPNKNMPNAGPQNQGSPMMTQGTDGNNIAYAYNANEMSQNGMRPGPNSQAGGTQGNHALQDYQMQLMLLEQQNKKRLMMARAEQDNMQPRPDGQGGPNGPGMGPNGQPFQGTSPQGGPRSVNSPNPSEQMKRGTPHMNNAGIPSPVPEGQNRGSPSAMNFIAQGGQMDGGMNPQFYKMNGMDSNMMPNGMRPPSSHPGFNPQGMTQQQQMMMQQRQQQQQQQQGWQAGPNGAPMVANPSQGAPQQTMGTPQQRNMPPPAAPAANANANGRTQPSSPQTAAPPTPQQGNKANPKKKNETKETKAKRATKKGSAANLNAGATPSADPTQEAATPTPATPITPVHQNSFKNGPNGAVQPVANGQSMATAPNAGVSSAQPDLTSTFNMNDNQFDILEFQNPAGGNMDVLTDFDFDSFLNDTNGGDNDNYNFDPSFLQETEISEAV
ncbi:hypothetical protein ACMFMF_007917 [Clarireedia jacksonii]